MEYKGYAAEIVFDEDAKILHGRIIGLKDVVTFEAENAAELEKEFQISVDDYLEYCMELGRDPEKPFSGRVLLRISKDVHRQLWLVSSTLGVSMNTYIANALDENLKQQTKDAGVQSVAMKKE